MRTILLAALVLGAAPAPAQDDLVKKIVVDAEKIRKSTRKISKESRDKIEKALGEKLADADLAMPFWECLSTVTKVSSMDKTAVRVGILTVKGPKGPVKIGVAAATAEKTLHVVRILENGDDKALDSKVFLGQFAGLEYTDQIYNGPDVLTAALRKAQEPAGKEVDVLVRMNSLMHVMGPAWDRMLEKIEKKDKTGADEAASIEKGFDDTAKLAAGATFLQAASADRFKGYATGAKSDMGELKGLIAGGKFDDAYRKSGAVDGDRCAKCHSGYRMRFREARLKHNIGNGYFSTKLEVGLPDPSLEASAQAVATGIRKAVLLMTEAK